MPRCLSLGWMLALVLGLAAPAQSASDVVPPGPIGDGAHSFYDQTSDCWVWDSEFTSPRRHELHAFKTDSHCQGRGLDGDAVLTWITPHRDGEVWKGKFQNGRFSGTASRQFIDGAAETSYADGTRNGRSLYLYKDGGRSETNFAVGMMDGAVLEVFADGSRVEGHYKQGEQVGNWIRTYHDGSRFEYPAPPPVSNIAPRGAFFGPDGARLMGIYDIPRMDFQHSPPVVYPSDARIHNEEGVVLATLRVVEDGSVEDVRLARSSGYPGLDADALAQFAHRRFTPGTVDGRPVASYILVRQEFRL